METKYPLIAVKISDLTTFVVTLIDFDNEQVYNTTSQNGSGDWYSFDEVYLMENADNELSIHDLIFNSDINYQNYDKINGDKHIFNNRFILDNDAMKQVKIKRYKIHIEEYNRVIKKS